MGLLSKKTPVATVEIAFLDGRTARVTTWAEGADRQEQGYNSVLLFLMHYARIMFFLSFREPAEELVTWLDEAVSALAAAEDGTVPNVTRGWTLGDDGAAHARATWTGTLSTLKPGEYRCANEKPADPQDTDAQMAVLLHLQKLIDTLPPLERAYLALGITGMHEYYRDIQHWNSSKTLHPAPAYGMTYARNILERGGGR